MSHFEVLESELRKFEIDLPLPQKLTLAAYCAELSHWNEKINLTGLSGAGLVRRLVVEPVWIGLQLNPSGVLADIGSGNGSPAIPLRVVCPFDACHLIESRARRVAFLRHVSTTLKLSGLQIHRMRFEEVAKTLGPIDWITLQGVALNPELIDSIKRMGSATTTIVWITSPGVQTRINPQKMLHVPFTNTQVLLFAVSGS